MPHTLVTIDLPEQLVASVRLETDLATIGRDIGDGFRAIMAALREAGGHPAGPPLVVYHDVINEETRGRVEMCVPVAKGFAGVGDVSVRRLPAGAAVSTVHRGRYAEIGPAYEALATWMADHDVKPAGPPREVYLNDPQEVGETEALTQVAWLIDRKPAA